MALPVQKCSPEATNTDLTQETLKSKIHCGSSGLLRQISQKDTEPEVLHALPYANSPQSLSRSQLPSDRLPPHICNYVGTKAVGTNAAGTDATQQTEVFV